VCPNLALMTYQTEAFFADLPIFALEGGELVGRGVVPFHVSQPHQIAVLTDFCNECGNCVTACPTSGKPYEDKPRLYLNEEEFGAQATNAFTVRSSGELVTVLGRFDGETHQLSINGSVAYAGPDIEAVFDNSFDLLSATPTDGAEDRERISLEPAAVMYSLWKGLATSMPELPTATTTGTRIPAAIRSS
jgi:putative selenate reductase